MYDVSYSVITTRKKTNKNVYYLPLIRGSRILK